VNEAPPLRPAQFPASGVKCLVFALAGLTLVTFWPLLSCAFANYDDPFYVTKNPHVQEGLSPASMRWALTSLSDSNWHPLTWLSLQLDYQVYRLNPVGYHLTNLLLHTANVLLLFWVLQHMTAALLPSALTAALFAIHPLHVESVAWVAERKDVLSTLFWLLTLVAYVRYVEQPGIRRYGWVALALALGLAAKAMIVTLPLVLLLLDFWPLGRLRVPGDGRQIGSLKRDLAAAQQVPAHPDVRASRWVAVRAAGRVPATCSLRWASVEKLPLLLLAAAACSITLIAQHKGGNLRTLAEVPLSGRVTNAFVAYATYLQQAFWPRQLAVFYPYGMLSWSDWHVWGAGLCLAAITAAAIGLGRRLPFFLVGWFWYLGTLLPAIGLVQVGDQAHADRYTYVPLVGVFLIFAWMTDELAKHRGVTRLLVLAGATTALAGCILLTAAQERYWHDSVALWSHTIAVTGPNAKAHFGLAAAYRDDGQVEMAAQEFRRALAIRPGDGVARANLAWCLLLLDRMEEADAEFTQLLGSLPEDPSARFRTSIIGSLRNETNAAVARLVRQLWRCPNDADAHLSLALWLVTQEPSESAFVKQRKREAARRHLEQAEHYDPLLRRSPAFQAAQQSVPQ
jgi:hypothetical protein